MKYVQSWNMIVNEDEFLDINTERLIFMKHWDWGPKLFAQMFIKQPSQAIKMLDNCKMYKWEIC